MSEKQKGAHMTMTESILVALKATLMLIWKSHYMLVFI